jgi:hypothetical protein
MYRIDLFILIILHSLQHLINCNYLFEKQQIIIPTIVLTKLLQARQLHSVRDERAAT